jgi:hypothetical protein
MHRQQRFASVVLVASALILGASAHASAQFCAPTTGGGWHPAASGTPGCVPLLSAIDGVSPATGPADFHTGTATTSTHGTLSPNDDLSCPGAACTGGPTTIDLTAAFPGGLRFFGGPYTNMVVNNNGNVTFGGGLFTYTPTPFPLSGGAGTYPMIAPYWGDVDTRGTGSGLVYYDLQRGRTTVTWDNVGYYSSHVDRRMSFQMILRNALDCGSGDFDVEFRFNRCEWTTGDASMGTGGFGGTPAQTGFDAHDGTNYVATPESLTANIINNCTGSNVGMPGIYQFSVRGGAVVCPGTGAPCDVAGQVGACAIGVTACTAATTTCQAVSGPTTERCDNIDNDCNGMVDDGDTLCPAGQVCSNGVCQPRCFEGACSMGYSCDTAGRCVETACIGVSCPAGQRCSGGSCIDQCSGVTCPHGQQCYAGRCIDLCNVLTCGMGEICQDGMCIPTCPCHACAADQTCGADGRCISTGCDLTMCDPGFYCQAGACLDACAGATCPMGQVCQLGTCVDGPMQVDAGVPGTDAGFPDFDSGLNFPDMGTAPVDGGSTGMDDTGVRPRPGRTTGGCCRVDGNGSPFGGSSLVAMILGLWIARRRAAKRAEKR